MNAVHIPPRKTAVYKAAELIYREGAQTEADLFRAIDFGHRRSVHARTLAAALEQGWLLRFPDGRIGLSSGAIEHLDQNPPAAPAYVGQVAAPRQINVLHVQPLSSKYRLNPRGLRDDVPPWSVRSGSGVHQG